MRVLLVVALALLVLVAPETVLADETVAVPEPTEKAMRYYHSGNLLWLVRRAWTLAIPLALLATGWSAKIRDFARRYVERWYLVVIVYFLLYLLVTRLVSLPLDYYAGFVRPHDYGLSEQALSKWMGDRLKGLGVAAIGGTLVVWIPFALLRKSPNRWWIYTSLVAIPLFVGFIVLEPAVIAPLFNDFGPMKDAALEADILALADRAGIEGSRVYEVNKSLDTTAVNAYVTGLGGTKRIVLWDTIIAKLDRRELLVVMGHEMGHYVLNHMLWGIAGLIVGLPIVLYVAHRASAWAIARYQSRFGFERLSDPAALPLVVLIGTVFGLVTMPIGLAFGRHIEHESDRYAIEITRDNHACATAFVKLQAENLGNPRPGLLFVLWRGSHPALGDRIDFCNEYRPWLRGDGSSGGDRN